MKVGDYVRTKDGFIARIKEIEQNERLHLFLKAIYTDNYKIDMVLEDEIIKSSLNIIDLIEEHDLVVIEYYSLRYNERVTRLFEVSFKDGEYINLSNAKCEFMLVNGEFNKGDKELEPIIKSIVTKEQFEAIKYEIK